MSHRVNKVRQFASYGSWRSDLAISFLYRPVNQQRPPNNIGLWHKPPIAAVVTIVPIVPHPKKMSLGKNDLPILYKFSKLPPPFRSLARRHIQPGKTIPERIIGGPAEVRIRLFQQHSVHEHLLVDQPYPVPRHANHPLHEMLRRIHRIMEYHDVTTVHPAVRHKQVGYTPSAVT